MVLLDIPSYPLILFNSSLTVMVGSQLVLPYLNNIQYISFEWFSYYVRRARNVLRKVLSFFIVSVFLSLFHVYHYFSRMISCVRIVHQFDCTYNNMKPPRSYRNIKRLSKVYRTLGSSFNYHSYNSIIKTKLIWSYQY